jgi:Tfp pilus assembly protein PilO
VTSRFASLSIRAQVALVACALLLVTALGYLALIAPKRSAAASLQRQTAAVQAQIDRNRSAAFEQALPAVRAASVFSLAKAMPTQLETPNLIVELNQLALDSGISFDQITPEPSSATSPVGASGASEPYVVEPIQVAFTGSFYDLLTFLQRLRNLVRVENGHLDASGRLFDVSNISFAAGPKGFPQVQATLTVNAFVPAPPQSTSSAAAGTSTTSTTTGATTTTSNPTSASPSTSGESS